MPHCLPGRIMWKRHGESWIRSLRQTPQCTNISRTPGGPPRSKKTLHPPTGRSIPPFPCHLQPAAAEYAPTLRQIAGAPPMPELGHLGLGTDGRTASLGPGEPVLNVENADLAIAGAYQGRRRMTLTYPMFNRSRRVLWVVTG